MSNFQKAVACAVFFLASDLNGACGIKTVESGFPVTNHTCLELQNQSPSVFSNQDLQYAISKWNCPGYTIDIPPIVIGESSCKKVTIEHKPGRSQSPSRRCEEVETRITGSTFLGAHIIIYTQDGSGTPCLPLREDIAHAIGHVYGLGDKDNAGCRNRIMGRRAPGTTRQAARTNDECAIADQQNVLYGEEDGEGGVCGPPGLSIEPVATERTALRVAGDVPRLVDQGSHRLARQETIDNIRYLLDEWAVVSVPARDAAAPRGGEIRASSAAFAVAMQNELVAGVSPAGEDSVALVVEAPVHPHNARHAPEPLVSWNDVPVAYLAPPAWAVVRVDLAEDRRIREVDVLAAAAQFPATFKLSQTVREGLDVEHRSRQQHRAFVYLVLEASAGRVSLRDFVVTQPQCCCTLYLCIPLACDFCI